MVIDRVAFVLIERGGRHPPPHAAKPTPRATATATSPAHRQPRRPSLDLRLDLCSVPFACMWLPFVVVVALAGSLRKQLYETEGHSQVTVVTWL